MAKKRKLKKDIEDEQGELEETLDEEKLKEIIESIKKESPKSNIDDNQFVEFLKPSTESFSPVLKRTETPRVAQQSSLEQGLAFVPSSEKDEKKDKEERNYITSRNKQDYNTPENKRQEEFSPQIPNHINLKTINREFRHLPRQAHFTNTELQAIQNQESETKYIEPEKIDMTNIGREKTSHRKVQKYEIR